MKNKSVSLVLLLSVFVVIAGVIFLKNYESETLVEAKWNEKEDELLAISIEGEEVSSFPTTKNYTASVTCTKGSGTASWNGSKWVFNATGINQAKTKCNVNFEIISTWDTPKAGTLLAAIKRDNTVTSTLTTPGSQASLAREAVLASAVDDYGTSYYFRGAVKNNFVEYANMCWRIVRVLGDSTIRLVLYNYNGLRDNNEDPWSDTPCNVSSTRYAYARYSGETYKSAFNTNYNRNAYVGFMYGNATGSTYALTHANTNKSLILTNLETWYANVLSKQSGFSVNQLVDAVWCNDKTVVTGTIGGRTYDGNGASGNTSAYGSSKRIMASNLAAGGTGPTFKCPTNNNNLSRFTVSNSDGNKLLRYPIGLLTVDEIAYAGSIYGNSTSGVTDLSDRNIYLMDNAADGFRSMTPYDYNGLMAIVFTVDGKGVLNIDAVNSANQGLRPAITVVNTVYTNGGDGTATNPYKLYFK